MKVLQAIDRLNIGGAERVMLNITKLLISRNIETGVLLFNAGFPLDKDVDSKAKLFVLHRKNKFSLAKLYKAHQICGAYDIVHVHMRHCYVYIRLAKEIFGGKYKLILHDHYGNIGIDKSIPRGFNSFFKPQYYIGVSQDLVKWALNILKVEPGNVYLLANTILPNSKISAAVGHNKRRAFIVSNIRPTKNIEFAISVFKKLNWECIIYGNKEDESYYQQIQGLIPGNSKINIVQGKTDMSDIYANHAIAIHSAISETGPLVLLEYLANGMPFLAYKTGDVADTLATEIPMLFIDTLDANEWVKRIEEILKDETLPGKLISLFEKYFSPERYIDECLRIYEEILC